MTKKELAQILAEKMQISTGQALGTINTVFEEIGDSIARGEMVQLIGFGTFEIRSSKDHKGINPHTGQSIMIKGRNHPKFRAGKSLKIKVESGIRN